jgi:hypothetical protein
MYTRRQLIRCLRSILVNFRSKIEAGAGVDGVSTSKDSVPRRHFVVDCKVPATAWLSAEDQRGSAALEMLELLAFSFRDGTQQKSKVPTQHNSTSRRLCIGTQVSGASDLAHFLRVLHRQKIAAQAVANLLCIDAIVLSFCCRNGPQLIVAESW